MNNRSARPKISLWSGPDLYLSSYESMSKPIKPYTTTEDQITLMRSRGMLVDEDEAAQWLKSVGYYRLSGYWYILREIDTANSTHKNTVRLDTFQSGTRFSEVIKLYEFDRKLRTLVHDGIERVEITVRTAIAETLAAINPLAFYSRENFRVTNRKEYDHYKILSTVTSRISRALTSKDSTHIRHNVETYDSLLPVWVLTDVLDFGDLSKIYALFKSPEQIAVAARLGFDISSIPLTQKQYAKFLESHPFSAILLQLTILRNKSAHHARIWNCSLPPVGTSVFSQLDSMASLPQDQSEKIYGSLVFIAKILEQASPGSTWTQKVKNLVQENVSSISFLTENQMGFPLNWQNEDPWK